MEILVDSSVWIDFFNGVPSPPEVILHDLLEAEDPLCLSNIILAETLQGFKEDRDFESAKSHLLTFPVYSLATPEGYVRAAQLYRKCRKRGLTIRNTVDCLIAQTAIEHRLILLHNDSDFDRIATVSDLRILHP